MSLTSGRMACQVRSAVGLQKINNHIKQNCCGFLCQNNNCIERNGIKQSYSNFDSLRIELERHFKYVYVHIFVGSTKGRTILVDLYILGF